MENPAENPHFEPINVSYLIHFATPGKCNTFDTSINKYTNNSNRLDKKSFLNNLITGALGFLLGGEPKPVRPFSKGVICVKSKNNLKDISNGVRISAE